MRRFLSGWILAAAAACGDGSPLTDALVTDAPVPDAPVSDAPISDAPVPDAPDPDAPDPDAPVSDAANVDAPVRQLTVEIPGGGGRVTSGPTGIDCPTVCDWLFGVSAVNLTATADPGNAFLGWSGGGCTGTGPCTVTLDMPKTVRADFGPAGGTLTLRNLGGGAGVIATSLGGCGNGTCVFHAPVGTVVDVTQVAAGGSTFTGWGDACTGVGACTVTLTASTVVSASFAPPSSQDWVSTGAVPAEPEDLAVNGTHVVAVGASGPPGAPDSGIWIARLGTDGSVGPVIVENPTPGRDLAFAVAVDDAGNLTTLVKLNNTTVELRRYDLAGSLVWQVPLSDADDVDVDETGRSYVAGEDFVASYDTSGVERWQRPAVGYDSRISVENGIVAVGGVLFPIGSQLDAFDVDGTPLWDHFLLLDHRPFVLEDVATDGAGNVQFAAFRGEDLPFPFYVGKIAASGGSPVMNAIASCHDYARLRMIVHPDGGLRMWLGRCGGADDAVLITLPLGPTWLVEYQIRHIGGLATDGAGNIYTAYSDWSNGWPVIRRSPP